MKHKLAIYEIFDAQGDSMAVAVEEPSDTAQMWGTDKDGNHQNYEDDAYHCHDWAKRHGFIVRVHTIELDLRSHTVTDWLESHPNG
jgi:hypothetical protein